MRPPALSLHRPLRGARARIFALPHAGGGASAFLKLRGALGAHHVELCPLQPPGRENRSSEPPHETVEALAEEFAKAIETLASLPFAILGHSFGALVAYLAASALSDRGICPDHLVVSGSLSPALRGKAAAPSPAGTLRERIVALGGIPDAILAEPDLLAMFETGIRADIAMSDAYRHVHGRPLPCPITVYSGTDDAAAPPALAAAWQRLTDHDLRMRRFDGGHFFLYAEPEVIAEALVADLGWG